MRADLCVLWFEDNTTWYEQQRELLEEDMSNRDLIGEFESILKKESISNFKKYDIFFVDYSLSSESKKGSDVIKKLRGAEIAADILFYSAENIREIRKSVTSNIETFEGVYISARNQFRSKSIRLIEKNSKRLMSIKNIRGILTESTSENDFIMQEFSKKQWKNLDKKHEILKKLEEGIDSEIDDIEKVLEGYKNNKEKKLKNYWKLPTYICPIRLRYKIFQELLKYSKVNRSVSFNYDEYNKAIVSKRNMLAHQKLLLCSSGKHLVGCSNLQKLSDIDLNDCNNHLNQVTMDEEEWRSLKLLVNEYAAEFDKIGENLSR